MKTQAARSMGQEILIGALAGWAGNLASVGIIRLLDRIVSPEQNARDLALRGETPFEKAGSNIARLFLRRELIGDERKKAGHAFFAVYGLGWGLAHSALRRRYPALMRAGGLPFASAFFTACDGVIAPSLRLAPPLHRLPVQPSAREYASHIGWTWTAERVQRRFGSAA